jgi:hypothetical protein
MYSLRPSDSVLSAVGKIFFGSQNNMYRTTLQLVMSSCIEWRRKYYMEDP